MSEVSKIMLDLLKHVPENMKHDVQSIYLQSKFDEPNDPIFAISLHLLFLQLNSEKKINEFKEIIEKLSISNDELKTSSKTHQKRTLLSSIIFLSVHILLVCGVLGVLFFSVPKGLQPSTDNGKKQMHGNELYLLKNDLEKNLKREVVQKTKTINKAKTTSIQSFAIYILVIILLSFIAIYYRCKAKTIDKKLEIESEVDNEDISDIKDSISNQTNWLEYKHSVSEKDDEQPNSSIRVDDLLVKAVAEKLNKIKLNESPTNNILYKDLLLDWEKDIVPKLSKADKKKMKRIFDSVVKDLNINITKDTKVEQLELSF